MIAFIASRVALGICLAGAPAVAAPADRGVEAITKPSHDVRLSFVRAGRIAEVLVVEGDRVRAGQPLMRQDDTAEQIQLAQLKAQAEDDTKISYATAQLNQKRVHLKRLEELRATATTLTEIEMAKLDVTIAELSEKLAKFEQTQDRRKYEELKAQVDRMRLTSPIDGTVEMLAIRAGESADPQTPVVRVVQVDPLWVDVYVPLEQARKLRLHHPALVEYDEPGAPVAGGTVVYTASVAEPASGTLMVRVEAPNPSGRPAGERAFVSFPPPPNLPPRPAARTSAAKIPTSLPATSQPATQPATKTTTQPKTKE